MSVEDDAALAAYAMALADAIDAVIGPWVYRCVEQFIKLDDARATRVRAMADVATSEVSPRVRALLRTDIDEQRNTPLGLLRDAVRYPTELLREFGVIAPDRDDFARRTFPDDVFALTPATFADVDPSLQEPGLVWGAAKAHVFLQRRRTSS